MSTQRIHPIAGIVVLVAWLATTLPALAMLQRQASDPGDAAELGASALASALLAHPDLPGRPIALIDPRCACPGAGVDPGGGLDGAGWTVLWHAGPGPGPELVLADATGRLLYAGPASPPALCSSTRLDMARFADALAQSAAGPVLLPSDCSCRTSPR